MKLFKEKDTGAANGADKAAGWIAGGIHKVQSAWARAMGRLFNRLPPLAKKALLIGFCLVAVAYSTMLLAFSFKRGLRMPEKISGPVAIIKPLSGQPNGMPAFIRRIERFKRYLDSLGTSSGGRRIRDSILQKRPGLLDSIHKIETIYCPK